MTQAAVCLSIAFALAAGVLPGPETLAPAPQPQQRVVWTNDELAEPDPTAAVSRFGDPAAFELAAAEPRAYQKEFDPEWYRERLQPLEAERDAITARIAGIRAFLANPLAHHEPGLRLDRARMRLSPQNELELLEARRAELEAQISELLDEARRHWLPPGLLR